jgi:RimJ/RimL family protein N-acetyltransferase
MLADPRRLLLIIEANGKPAGMLRLDRLEDRDDAPRHEIAIAVDTACYGRGIAAAALRGVRELMPQAVFDAIILPENRRSQTLFKHAGFVPLSADLYRNSPSRIA